MVDLNVGSLDIDGPAWHFSGNPAGFLNGQLAGTSLFLQPGEELVLESITLDFTTVYVPAGAVLSIGEGFEMFFSQIDMVLNTECDPTDPNDVAILFYFGGDSPLADEINGSGSINVYGGDNNENCQKASIEVGNNTNLQVSNEIDINVTGGELFITPHNDSAFDLFGTSELFGESSRVTIGDHVENYGSVRVLEGSELLVDASIGPTNGFDNDGLIESIDSTLRLVAGWRNYGTINITGGNNNLIALARFEPLDTAGTINFDNTEVTLDFDLQIDGSTFFYDFTFTNSTVDFIGNVSGNFSNGSPLDTSSLPDNFTFASGFNNGFNGTIVGSQPMRVAGNSSFANLRLETDLILQPRSTTSFNEIELVNTNLIVVSRYSSSVHPDTTLMSLGFSITGVGSVISDSDLSSDAHITSAISDVPIELGPDITLQLMGPGTLSIDVGEGDVDIKAPVFADSGSSRLAYRSATRLHDQLHITNCGLVTSYEDVQFVGPNSSLTIEAESNDFGNALFAYDNSSIDVSDATLSVISDSGYVPEDCKEFDVLNYSPISSVTQFAAFGNLTVGGKLLEIDYSPVDKTILRVPGVACP